MFQTRKHGKRKGWLALPLSTEISIRKKILGNGGERRGSREEVFFSAAASLPFLTNTIKIEGREFRNLLLCNGIQINLNCAILATINILGRDLPKISRLQDPSAER